MAARHADCMTSSPACTCCEMKAFAGPSFTSLGLLVHAWLLHPGCRQTQSFRSNSEARTRSGCCHHSPPAPLAQPCR